MKDFNFNELRDQFKNVDWKNEWSNLQEESPKIAGAIKILVFAIIGAIVLRSCNSCNSQPANTDTKQEQVDTVKVDEVNKQNNSKENSVANVSEYNNVKDSEVKNKNTKVKKIDYQYTIDVFNEQLKNLYSQPELRNVEVDDLRKAYFDAQKHWYEDFLLKKEDGQFVNLRKYLD